MNLKRSLAAILAGGLTAVIGLASMPAAATVGAFQNVTSTGALGASARSVTVPAGTSSGDTLVTQVAINASSVSGITAPAGWTLGCSQAGAGISQGLWVRTAGGSEPASYSWSLPANSGVVASMARYTGVAASPVDGCAGQASATAGLSVSIPSVSVSEGDELVIAAVALTGAGTVTPGSGYTERADAKTAKDTATPSRAVSAEVADISSGACTSVSCTVAAATATAAMLTGEPTPQWSALQMTLRPSVPAAPYNTAIPVMSGRWQSGQTLSATNGTWLGSPTSYSYQWQDCTSTCTNISGATSSTYALTAGDVGHRVRVQVTATNAGGSTTANSGNSRFIGWLFDPFTGSAGIITNDYAYWNPGLGTYNSADWELNSGCLFRDSNTGGTRTPDSVIASYDSCSPTTQNDVFRLNTKATFSGNTAIELKIKQNTDIHNGSCTPSNCYYGAHVWTRHVSEYDLYYVSVQRADGDIVIKRKVPCGTDNDGTYFALTSETPYDWTAGSYSNFKITTETISGGSAVQIKLFDTAVSNTVPILTGTDSGGTNPNWSAGCTTPGKYASSAYPPITSAGQSGIRGDHANLTFDDFHVYPF